MMSKTPGRTTLIRAALAGATFFTAGLAFLPLVTSAAQITPPDCPPKPWSLVGTYNWDLPYGNCCVIKYKPGCSYSNPAACIKCHTPAPWPRPWEQDQVYDWSDFEAPPEFAGEPCLRFE